MNLKPLKSHNKQSRTTASNTTSFCSYTQCLDRALFPFQKLCKSSKVSLWSCIELSFPIKIVYYCLKYFLFESVSTVSVSGACMKILFRPKVNVWPTIIIWTSSNILHLTSSLWHCVSRIWLFFIKELVCPNYL